MGLRYSLHVSQLRRLDFLGARCGAEMLTRVRRERTAMELYTESSMIGMVVRYGSRWSLEMAVVKAAGVLSVLDIRDAGSHGVISRCMRENIPTRMIVDELVCPIPVSWK